MIILEGCDAVGKTTTINALKKYDIKDRDKLISKYMNFNISTEERANFYYDYLSKTDNIIIFLINNDKEELERRVKDREIQDEYDKMAYLYNLLYLETYNYMEYKNLNKNLYLVDTTSLSVTEQIKKVEDLIKCLI